MIREFRLRTALFALLICAGGLFLSAPARGLERAKYDYGLSQPSSSAEVLYERDVTVPLRGGASTIADVYRPTTGGRHPVILNIAPYTSRHQAWDFASRGIDDPGENTEHLHFEMPNPDYWIKRGYVYVTVVPQGYAGAPGGPNQMNLEEAKDLYDAIEWAARQPWATGNVGMLGISYYAFSQYWGASLKPPHLKAIVPWEGLSRPYFDVCYKGGVPDAFCRNWAFALTGIWPTEPGATNWVDIVRSNPLFNETWEELTNPDLTKLDIPMLSVNNLEDIDLHLTGGVDAFEANQSPDKRMLLYAGTHWGSAYQPWATRQVLQFFDHWLKGKKSNGLDDRPPVQINVRTGTSSFENRFARSYPVPGTKWKKWFMRSRANANGGRLGRSKPDSESESRLTGTSLVDDSPAAQPGTGSDGVGFVRLMPVDSIKFTSAPMRRKTDIAGPVTAHLWVSSDAPDADIMVELEDIAPDGTSTYFASYFAEQADVPVTRGRIRLSARRENPKETSPHKPVYLQTKSEPLAGPEDVVKVNVRLAPTAMRFKKGHRIRVSYAYVPIGNIKGEADSTVNRSPSQTVTFHSGPDTPSSLELPVLPRRSRPTTRVKASEKGFGPRKAAVSLGERVLFRNVGIDYRSTTDASGLKLWDSQLLRGERSHLFEAWPLAARWAAKVPYEDRVTGQKGAIAVAPEIVRSSGAQAGGATALLRAKGRAAGRVRVKVGTRDAPEGTRFQVARKVGGGSWTAIGTTKKRALTAKLPSARRVVRFRSRLIGVGSKKGSRTKWSPPVTARPSGG